MDAQHYLRVALFAIICIVVATVSYALTLNRESAEHIEKMEEAQYSVLKMTRADYRTVHPTVKEADITVKALWTIDVKAQHEGVLTDIFAQVGQSVGEGTALARMSNEELGAQLASTEASIAEARASLLNSEKNLERYTRLIAHDAAARKDYDNAVAQRDAAKAQLDNRIAQRDMTRANLSKLEVFAPNSAVVVNVYHKAGDYVRAGEALFLLSDFSELQAYSILEHDELKTFLAHGNEFILEIPFHRLTHRIYPIAQSPNFDGNLLLNQFYARVENVVPDISVNVDYHEVTWHVINRSAILEPTYYNDVTFTARSETKILAVPDTSIHVDGAEVFVYGVDADNSLIKVPVTTGVTDGNFVEITSGLKQGDLVVTDDLMAYTIGMKVRASVDGGQ